MKWAWLLILEIDYFMNLFYIKGNIDCAGGRFLKSFSSSKVKTEKVIAVAQTRLNFIKPTHTGVVLYLFIN